MAFLDGFAKKLGVLDYKGTWDASTNIPAIVNSVGSKGEYYVVAVAGNTTVNNSTGWNIGDWVIFNGTVWQKIDNSELVTSVAGKTGDVTLTKTDVGLSSVPDVDATLRSNHSGTQLASTISNFSNAVQAVTVSLTKVTSLAVVNTTITYLNITELTTPTLTPGMYRFTFFGLMQSAAANNGVGIRLVTSTAALSTIYGQWSLRQGVNGTAANFIYDQTAVNTNIVSASVITANTDFFVSGQGIFRVTTAGTVTIEIRSETAGTAITLKPDAVLSLELIQ